MNNLINIETITINKQQTNGVIARNLHEFLENKRQFADWIKQRIDQYGFIENEDFTVHKFVNGKATQIDYYITLDMAKELAMVENNEKGKQARKYFLECEKKLKNSIQVPTTFKEALQLALVQQEKLEEQTKLITEYQPKINYLDNILQSKSLVCITQIAKDYGRSGKVFNDILQALGIQYKINDQWVLFSKYQAMGYTHSRTINITRSNGKNDAVMLTEWTQAGRQFLYEKLKQNGILPVIEQDQSIPTPHIQLPKLQHVNGHGA
ncbi:phage antirepressor KilAC domain-containing protein [Rickettsiales bacterium LUAb2]